MARTLIEDLLAERTHEENSQYVLLGAGLDTFAQRTPALASRLQVFAGEEPGPHVPGRPRG